MKKQDYQLWLEAIKIMGDNLNNRDFQRNSIYEKLNISESKLSRVFRKYGKSPWKFFMWCRLAFFCRRLQESEGSISKIRGEFGFANKAISKDKGDEKQEMQIIRWFESELKCTPSEYLKIVRNLLNNSQEEGNMSKNTILLKMLGCVESLSEIMARAGENWEELAVLAQSEYESDLGMGESISYLRGFSKKGVEILQAIKDFVSNFGYAQSSDSIKPPIRMAKLLFDLQYNTEQILLQVNLILMCFFKYRSKYEDAQTLYQRIDENKKTIIGSVSLLRRYLLYTDLRDINPTDIAACFGTVGTLYMILLDDPASAAYAALMEEYEISKDKFPWEARHCNSSIN